MKILLAIDGSPHAQETIRFLTGFPFQSPPEIIVVHACFVPNLHDLGSVVTADVNRLVDEFRTEGENLLKLSATKCETWAQHVSTRLLSGIPAKEILKCARQEHVDLIVIGSRGLGSVNRFLLGSVSEKVTLYAPCSVLVVRSPHSADALISRTILFADDASDEISLAIETFAQLPLGPERRVSLLGLLEFTHNKVLQEFIENNPFWKAQAAELEGHLLSSQRQLAATKAAIQSQLLKSEHTANAILKAAEEQGADLIVLGSTGKNTWERLLLGSVSTRVLRHAHCSVWIQRIPSRDR